MLRMTTVYRVYMVHRDVCSLSYDLLILISCIMSHYYTPCTASGVTRGRGSCEQGRTEKQVSKIKYTVNLPRTWTWAIGANCPFFTEISPEKSWNEHRGIIFEKWLLPEVGHIFAETRTQYELNSSDPLITYAIEKKIRVEKQYFLGVNLGGSVMQNILAEKLEQCLYTEGFSLMHWGMFSSMLIYRRPP